MASNPTDICGAPVNICLGLDIKDHAMCVGGLRQISTSCVEDSLWFGGSSRGIENKERVLAFEEFRGMRLTLAANNFVPPDIAI